MWGKEPVRYLAPRAQITYFEQGLTEEMPTHSRCFVACMHVCMRMCVYMCVGCLVWDRGGLGPKGFRGAHWAGLTPCPSWNTLETGKAICCLTLGDEASDLCLLNLEMVRRKVWRTWGDAAVLIHCPRALLHAYKWPD